MSKPKKDKHRLMRDPTIALCRIDGLALPAPRAQIEKQRLGWREPGPSQPDSGTNRGRGKRFEGRDSRSGHGQWFFFASCTITPHGDTVHVCK
ncbi:MAG: hypothetical protein U1G07_05580 [Verrucomicrobiota bacterium]